MLAQQALTTQAIIGGRLALGIGLSHQLVIEGMYGMSFAKPLRHMREYLSILAPIIRDGAASFAGETLTGHVGIDIKGATPCPVLLAALGPKMLELAGTVGDGTLTWMTGPVCVTDDVAGARARAAKNFAIYGTLPSYRAMLDREGAAGPEDVAFIGDEAAVRASIEDLAAKGASDFVANAFGSSEERDRTRALLHELV
jgi:5,10-methylenetetrahydromethanopterin reductase